VETTAPPAGITWPAKRLCYVLVTTGRTRASADGEPYARRCDRGRKSVYGQATDIFCSLRSVAQHDGSRRARRASLHRSNLPNAR